MRLDQNVSDSHSLWNFVEFDLDAAWTKWKSIMRAPGCKPSKGHMMPKMTHKRFYNEVYHLAWGFRPEAAAWAASEDDNDSDGDPPDDPPPPGDAKPGGPPGDRARGSRDPPPGGGGAGRPGGGADGGGGDGGDMGKKKIRGPRHSPISVLLRQWLATALEPFMWISIPIPDHGWRFLQVLQLEKAGPTVKTFRERHLLDAEHTLYEISVQMCERWRSHLFDDLGLEAEVFACSDPEEVDLLTLAGGGSNMALCESWRVWQPELSDVSGCTALRSPAPLRSRFPLDSPVVPILDQLFALASEGWSPRSAKIFHDHRAELVYDDRKLTCGMRSYFRCLLCSKEFFDARISFVSGQPSSYYDLLLKRKVQVPPNLGAAKYKEMLAGLSHEDAVKVALRQRPSDLARPPAAKRHCVPAPVVASPEGSVAADSSAGEEGEVEAPRDLALGPELVAEDERVHGEDEKVHEYAKYILGQKVEWRPGRCDEKWTYSDRMAVKCMNRAHSSCMRSRSVTMMVGQLGPRAAEAFLGAWLLAGKTLTEGEHGTLRPSIAQMREYLANH